jgi:hypothetical protein
MPVHPEQGVLDGSIFVVDGVEDGCRSSCVLNCQRRRLSGCRSFTMPTIKQNDQPEDHKKDEKDSPSSAESNSSKVGTRQVKQSKKVAVKKKTVRKKAAKTVGVRTDPVKKKTSQTRRKQIQNEESDSSKAETRQIKQSKKVAVKKKTARKKAAKTVGVRTDSAKKEISQTTREEIQLERPSGPDQGASVTGGEAGKAPPAEQNQPEKPAEVSVSPAAAPPHSQPRGGAGLMGFWIKVGASAFVILASIIGIYSFFSEDKDASRPEATQAAASAQGDDASVADSVVAEPETARKVVFPPATEQSNVVDPGTFAGAAVANEPVVGTAITAGVTPGVTPAADQPLASQQDAAPPIPQSSHFSEEPAGYRPELYRPLEPEQDPPPPNQPSAVSETPRASFVPAPSYYPQPGAYAYPAAPYYGGYGRYYPHQDRP